MQTLFDIFRGHESRAEFWLISSPEVATPPALDALARRVKDAIATNSSAASACWACWNLQSQAGNPFFNSV